MRVPTRTFLVRQVREAEQRARLVVVSRELTPSPIAEGLVAPSRCALCPVPPLTRGADACPHCPDRPRVTAGVSTSAST